MNYYRPDFSWPEELRSAMDAAEQGTLDPRELYPVELKALCILASGVPIDGPREIAPGMSVTKKIRCGTKNINYERASFHFNLQFPTGRLWQCSLFTAWQPVGGSRRKFLLKPRNIVTAVTRSLPALEGSK